MLVFDGSYSHQVFSAGSPFIRRVLAYPRASIEPPPQTSSIAPQSVGLLSSIRYSFIQFAFRNLIQAPGGFLCATNTPPSRFEFNFR